MPKTQQAEGGSPKVAVDQIMARVVWNGDEDECWTWVGGKQGQGYGQIRVAGKELLAHRLAYELFVGPIPSGRHIDHLCRTRNCVNPSHLEAVSLVENVLRGNGFYALNARKTHCPKGHPYSGSNLYRTPKGHRRCRQCKRESRVIDHLGGTDAH